MGEIVCTLCFQETSQRDLVLPDGIPVQQLVRTLATALGLPNPDHRFYDLELEQATGQFLRLPETHTLRQARVLNGARLQLVHEDLPAGQRTFLVEPGGNRFRVRKTTRIGRLTADNEVDIDLSLLDTEKVVSRRHAQLTRAGIRLIVQDGNSHNGTFVNGQRLPAGQRYTLQAGDELCFGTLEKGVRLRVEMG
jgi:hypothetical protein